MDPLEIIKRDKKKWDKLLELVETQLTKIKDILQKLMMLCVFITMKQPMKSRTIERSIELEESYTT